MKRLPLCLLGLLCCNALWPQDVRSMDAVPQARVAPDLVRLPVVEGDDIRFQRLSGVEGLSQNRVTQIVQDDQGFVWFATQYGVNRYDGYQFKVFKNDPADPGSLCGVILVSLFKDRAGNLWMGCEFGLDRFEPATETFTHYQIAAGIPHAATAVRHIYEDAGGMLWLSTGSGLCRLDPHSRKTTWFQHEAGDPLSLSSSDVKSSGEDRQGVFWVASGEGIDAFDRTTGHVTFHVPLREPHELSFYEDRGGVFWILSASGNGLATLDRKQGLLTRYTFAARDLPGLPLTGAIGMLEDRQGDVWVGTLSDGLLRFDRQNARFIRYRNDPRNPDSLPEDRITTLLGDREGNIWIGLGATQPTFFAPRSSPFSRLPFDSGNRANLGEKLVDVIFQDRAGVLWVGTTGALDRCDSTGRQCSRYALPGHGVASDVLSIIEDRPGNLWVGTSGQGLCRFDRAAGRCQMLRHADDDPTSLSNDSIYSLLIDHAGVLWAGTGDGLNRFDPLTPRFYVYRDASSPKSGFARAPVPSMVEDKDGNLWLATFGSGLLRFDRRAERLEAFSPGPSGAATLSNLMVNSVYVDRMDRLWAATHNGLDLIDPKRGVVARYSERNGLASADVSCMLEDAHGDLWLSTTQGISRFDPAAAKFQNFSLTDGVPGDLTAYSACFKNARGEMYFGGFAGATRFRPEEVAADSYAPPVALTAFDLFGAPVSIGPDSPLKRVIGFTRELTLAHDQNSLSFQFAALSFRNPATNRYRYKLEGLDENWHEVGSDRRYATYTTLPSGTYRFRLQGATVRGPWSEPGVTVSLDVKPAWWATWWFRTLLALAVLLTILALYLLRVRQVADRVRGQLEVRMAERERIARDLHDTLLQGIHGLVLRFQVAAERIPKGEPAREMLDRALERADQVLDEGRAHVKALRSPVGGVPRLPQTLAGLAAELAPAEGPPLRITVEGGIRELDPIVREELTSLAREALANAYRHARAEKIEAEVSYGDDALTLRIRDDGLGIDRALLREGRPGHYGLLGMRERTKKLRGRLGIWSKPGAGTELEVRVPAEIAYRQPAERSRRRRWWRKAPTGDSES